MKPIIALIYDFDKTLSPRDMQEYGFMAGINMEARAFWKKCGEFTARHQADGILAYMYMMQHCAEGNMALTRERLRELGKTVEFFPGVESWFDRINAIGEAAGVSVEHYIISSGLAEIIEGSKIGDRFKAIFASSFCYDDYGRPVWPATCVNYTAKTQYLFRINKGILDITNDADLNAYTPDHKRRVPFSNMIYFGDGLTDVPTMKMTRQKGGYSIVVHPPGKTELSDDMLVQGRADFSEEADYRAGEGLEETVRGLIVKIAAGDALNRRHTAQTDMAGRRRGNVEPNAMARQGIGEQDTE